MYLLYTVIILLTLPLENFISLMIMEDLHFLKVTLQIKKGIRRYIFRILLAIFYLFLVSFLKDIASVLAFMGSLSAIPMCFIIPVVLYKKNIPKD